MLLKNPLDAELRIINEKYCVIDPGYTTDKLLNKLHRQNSIFYNKPILEMFGLGTYKDDNVIEAVDEIIDDIVPYINKSIKNALRYVIENPNIDKTINNQMYINLFEPDTKIEFKENKIYTKKFETYIDNDWIEKLNVYVSFDFNATENDAIYNDYMTLSDSSAEYVENNNNTGYIINQVNFIIKDINKPRKHKIEIIKNKQYEEASVLLIIRNAELISKQSSGFDYIIKHELEHLYYRLINDITNIKDNSDTIEQMFYNIDVNIEDIDKYNKMLSILNDIEIDDKKRIEIIKNMDYQSIQVYIMDILYLLNASELHARLMNFVQEIRTIEKLQEYKEYINGPYSKTKYLYALCKISSIFNSYYMYYHNFELFIKYINDDVKCTFSENDIKSIFNKKRNHQIKTLPDRPYEINFSENDVYDEKVFDAFFNFHRKRIKHIFLETAMKLTIDYYCL